MQLVGILWFAVGVFLLVLKLFTRIKISLVWLALTALAPVAAVHIVNPLFRVWSFHSLMHGGIVYQIMNGNIPPPAPLVGGTPLNYPWGAHLLAAALSKAADITPYTSFAFINATSLLISIILAYKISKLLLDDQRANMLSALIPFFAVSLGPGGLTRLLPDAVPTEFRGIPLLGKYCTTNALPLGVVFTLMFLISGLRLLRADGISRNLLMVAGAVIGCGFFYPPFLPGLVAGAGAAFLLSLAFRLVGASSLCLKRSALLLAVVAGCLIVLRPYLTSVGGGIISQAVLFNPVWAGRNAVRYLVAGLPLLIVVVFGLSRLRRAIEHQQLIFMLGVLAGNLVCYLLIHLPFKGEYKFLLVSLVTLGILGGIGFRALLDRNRTLAFALLALLLFQGYTIITRTSQGREEHYHYLERGSALHTAYGPREELYAWIRDNTPTDAVFLDDDIDIPALAQRQLYIPPRRLWRPPPRRGYGLVRNILDLQTGYGSGIVESRSALIEQVYNPEVPLTRSQLDALRALPGPAYIISSGRALRTKLGVDLEEVFRTSGGRYRVHQVPEE
jgi:hypothetical protein